MQSWGSSACALDQAADLGQAEGQGGLVIGWALGALGVGLGARPDVGIHRSAYQPGIGY